MTPAGQACAVRLRWGEDNQLNDFPAKGAVTDSLSVADADRSGGGGGGDVTHGWNGGATPRLR
jgi:hypothetical protein